MVDKISSHNENDYTPVNRYIDEQSKLRKAKSFWINARSLSLILVAIGLLAVLLAWAYNIYKKPNPELVRKIEEVDKRFDQSQRIDNEEQKIVGGEVIKYNSKTQRFLTSKIDGYSIVTRLTYKKTKDLLEGNRPESITCYIDKGVTTFEFEQSLSSQKTALKTMGLSYEKAKSYQSYCKYNAR